MSDSSTAEPCTPTKPRLKSFLTPIVVSPSDTDVFVTPFEEVTPFFEHCAISSADATPLTPPTKRGNDSAFKLLDSPVSPLFGKTTQFPDYFTSRGTNSPELAGCRDIIKDEGEEVAGKPIFRLGSILLNLKRENEERAIGLVPSHFSFTFSMGPVPVLEANDAEARPKYLPKGARRKCAESSSRKRGARKDKSLARDLEHILPFSLQQRIVEKPEQCVASIIKSPTHRCTNKAKGLPHATQEAIVSLVAATEGKDYANVLSRVENLVSLAMCRTHINSAKKKNRFGKLEEILKDFTASPASVAQVDIDDIHSWLEATASLVPTKPDPSDIKSEEAVSDLLTTATPVIRTVTRSVARLGGEDLLWAMQTWLHFTPYQPQNVMNLTVSSALQRLISRPLGKADMASGRIYIFWYKGQFGHVKVGRSDNPIRRLGEWNKQCKRKHSFHKSTHDLIVVPHVNRIEKLIHTEMKERRKKLFCFGCGRTHGEWFEAEEMHAVAVFQKWKDWILTSPYEESPETGEWILKPTAAEALSFLCTPVKSEDGDIGGLLRTQPKCNMRSRRSLWPLPRRQVRFDWDRLRSLET